MNAFLKRICYALCWPLENADAPPFYYTFFFLVKQEEGGGVGDERERQEMLSRQRTETLISLIKT